MVVAPIRVTDLLYFIQMPLKVEIMKYKNLADRKEILEDNNYAHVAYMLLT
jgi:hypothetical protein